MAQQTDDFSLIRMSFDVLIVCLGIIGDAVILLGKGVFFVLKKTFSILFYLLTRFVFFLRLGLRRIFELVDRKRRRIFQPVVRTSRDFLGIPRIIIANAQKTQSLIVRQISVQKQKFHLPRFLFMRLHLPRFGISLPKPPGIIVGFVLGSLMTFFFAFIPYYLYVFISYLPNPRLLSQRDIAVTTQIFDRNGTLLYEIHGDENRKPIPLDQIPLLVKQATVAIEDKEFYTHPGFSVTGIARAARENLVNKDLQGGSTITQQLIKNALLTSEISYWRKLREVVLAFWAERIYTKDQILEMYLNQVPYGGTAWGIEAAAETYFGKKVQELTLAEAAYLAGLPAAPSYYSPYGSHPELTKKRQEEVLRRMAEDGYVTLEKAEVAKKELIKVKPEIAPIRAPHFVMYVRELLTQTYGVRLVDRGGLRIITTLDLPLQEKMQTIVTEEIGKLAQLKVGNGAALVTNPGTGDIVAMIGSKDYWNQVEDGNVNVTRAPRQPGSSIKVVTYAAALESGLTAASIIDDSPIAYPIPGQPTYTPLNYDGRFHGRVTLRSALANSYNVPAVKTLKQIGVGTMIDMGKRMGISTWEDRSRFGLALTLGGGEVTLLDMASVYGTLARGGARVIIDPILKVSDYKGRVFYEKKAPQTKHVISAEIAFIISDILADNRARTPAFGANSALVIPGKTVSVKTGTTNEKRDNWTIGYTKSVVVGVWVGNNNNSPMDPVLTSGVTGAAPIWNKMMTEILKNKEDEKLTPPANIVSLPCFGRSEYFVKGTEPRGGCRPFPSPSSKPSG